MNICVVTILDENVFMFETEASAHMHVSKY